MLPREKERAGTTVCVCEREKERVKERERDKRERERQIAKLFSNQKGKKWPKIGSKDRRNGLSSS